MNVTTVRTCPAARHRVQMWPPPLLTMASSFTRISAIGTRQGSFIPEPQTTQPQCASALCLTSTPSSVRGLHIPQKDVVNPPQHVP
eukprot:scaffold306458_cov35-Tisochrysis_lutea.AAC.1